jgi:hypothetical protein
MRITIKSVRTAKTGTGQKGPWELIAVTSSKGTEYTTFDKKVKHLGEGSVIEIGEPDEKDGKLSFKEVVEVVKEVAPAAPGGNGKEPGGYKRDTDAIQLEYELKAGMQAIERASIEAQTAFNGIITLMGAAIAADKVDDQLRRAVEKALKWAEDKLDNKLSKAPVPAKAMEKKPAPGKAEEKAEEKPEPRFAHIGALLNYCAEYGIDRAQAMKIWQVKDADLARLDIDSAATLIDDYIRGKHLQKLAK